MSVSIKKMAVTFPDRIVFILIKDIVLIECTDKKTKVYFKNGEIKFFNKTLAYFSERLKSDVLFFEPNECYIVNLEYLKRYSLKDRFLITISPIEIKLDIAKKNEFKERIKNISY